MTAHTEPLDARPRVSVVMPVRNGERYIDEAIGSILDQTVRDLELIVVVNGSTDGTLAISNRYAAADPRVRVLEREAGNIPLALNAGIEAARAPWIARMDADDVALPERLERQLALLERHPDVAAVATWGWRIGEHGEQVSAFRLGPTSHEEFRRIRDTQLIYLLSSSVVFSSQVARELGGFNPDYPVAQDIEFWTRIADDHIVLTIPEPLVHYRVHEGAISTTKLSMQMRNARRAELNMRRRRSGLPELSPAAFERMEAERSLWERLRLSLRTRSQYCYRRGGGLLAARNLTGIAWLLGAFVVYPPLPLKRLRNQAVLPVLMSRIRTHSIPERSVINQ